MKQTLMMLPLLAFGFTPVYAATASFPLNLDDVSGVDFVDGVHFGSADANQLESLDDNEISLAIQNLSAKAQQNNESLTDIASRLSVESKSSKNRLSALSGSRTNARRHISSSSAPAIAASFASRAAHSRSRGRCAMYVRKALQAAGYSFTPNESAYQYASNGTLKQAGFVKISRHSKPQIGDIVVYNRSSKHRHGHIQIYDGNQWVSDFRQDKMNPYSDTYSYTMWRDARYVHDASDNSQKGIYLAMAE